MLTRPTSRPSMLNGWRWDLLGGVTGRVLEIGARHGPNFRFYPAGARVVATDVSGEALHGAARLYPRWSGGAGLGVADAQHLPFADNSFDVVVATLVFCSIPEPRVALAEIARVLVPGGRLHTIDHVRSDNPVLGGIMDVLAPPYKAVAAGCNLNRQTEAVLREAGYTLYEHRRALGGILRFFIAEPPHKV
jgi:ubiquinone/menaquinone biosynthesis C-methylase UbiE